MIGTPYEKYEMISEESPAIPSVRHRILSGTHASTGDQQSHCNPKSPNGINRVTIENA
jgi:hypothetical protein